MTRTDYLDEGRAPYRIGDPCPRCGNKMIQTHQPYEVQCTKCGFDWDNWSGKSIHGIQPDDKLICDRCKKPIDGFRSEGFTAGYYDTTTLEPWGKYANSDEKFVCDACMWADPRYIADYGDNRPVKS